MSKDPTIQSINMMTLQRHGIDLERPKIFSEKTIITMPFKDGSVTQLDHYQQIRYGKINE